MNNIEQYQVPVVEKTAMYCLTVVWKDVGMGLCQYVDLCILCIIPTLFAYILFGIPSLHLFTFFLFSCYIFLKISRSVCIDAVPAAAAVTLRTYATHSSSGNSLQSANIVRSNTAVECGCRVCATSLSPYRTLTTSIHQHQTSLHF